MILIRCLGKNPSCKILEQILARSYKVLGSNAGLSFSSDDHEAEYSDLHDSDVEPPVQEMQPSVKVASTTGVKEQPTRRKVLPAKFRMDGCVGVDVWSEQTSEFK